MVIDCSVKGTRPLLHHDSKEEEMGVQKKGRVYDPQIESDKSLITDQNGKVCQHSRHLEATMIKSAVDFKFQGKKTYKELFKAGIFVEPLFIPHNNPDWVIDSQWERVQTARVMRHRPRFDDWSLDFQIECKDDRIEALTIKTILENAGKYYGIGDKRPRYGLFEVTKFEVNGKGSISD